MNYCYQHSQSLDQPESIKHTRFLQKQNNLKYPSSLKLSIILDNIILYILCSQKAQTKDEASGTAITVPQPVQPNFRHVRASNVRK